MISKLNKFGFLLKINIIRNFMEKFECIEISKNIIYFSNIF